METTSFINKCKGIALVFSSVALLLFGAAALLFSSTPAQADTPQSSYSTGKYGMSMSTSTAENGYTYWYVIVWDTETGRSKVYYGSPKGGETVEAGETYQLPSSPL